MKKYIFGLDKNDYAGSALKLMRLGYDGVVLSAHAGETAFAAAHSAGLEVWACYGAHYIGAFSKEEHGAIDATGNLAPWFGSACPNSREVNEHNLNRAFSAITDIPYLSGIFVDGARFASFASTEGTGSFFSCFCPRCMAKMGEDGEEIRTGINSLIRFLRGEKADITALKQATEKWLDFRSECVKAYIDDFAFHCHEHGLKAGAFVFAPSLGKFVGQTPYALTSLDTVAPMLYRAYPHEDGVACLSHEWAAFKGLLSQCGLPAEYAAKQLFGVDVPPFDPIKGFSPQYVAEEVKNAKAALAPNTELLPIIQTEDDELDKVYTLVFNAGGNGCGEFAYSLKTFK